MTRFRTQDLDLREARRLRLLSAARTASDAVPSDKGEILVTGSLARGQVHPWSDLDLILKLDEPEKDYGLRHDVIVAVEESGFHDFDLIMEDQIIPQMAKGLLGGAVPVAAIPILASLPDADLAPLRAAQSLEITCEKVRETMEELTARSASGEDTEEIRSILLSYVPQMSRDRLREKAGLALKRLAAFQDGGQSSFLDGDRSEGAVQELLDRLAQPADEPMDRPAMLTPEALPSVLWLMSGDDGDETDLDKKVMAALDACEGWAKHLRSTTELTQAHGLSR